MSNFINTIDVLGDIVVADSIINKTITEFKDNVVTTIGELTFNNCRQLEIVDLPSVTYMGNRALQLCSKLKALILRNTESVCTITSNSLYNSAIAKKTGYVYVPRALVDTYKTATNWSTYANQFRVLEDYTVDGTTTGEFVMPSMTRKFIDRSITRVDSALITNIQVHAFNSCSQLDTLILRNEAVVTLNNTMAFASTPIASKKGYIYVPSVLIEDYKVATNWKTYASQFRAIEDYPEICGGGN